MISQRPRVLVVEDEVAIRTMLEVALRGEGYEVRTEADGRTLEEVFDAFRPDLAVLDVRLPVGPDGYGMAKTLRQSSNLPLLFLTAADAGEDRLAGFDAGADDYLIKPFSMAEFLARAQALLRRAGRLSSSSVADRRARRRRRRASGLAAGVRLELTRTEYDLLSMLAQARRQGPVEDAAPHVRLGLRRLRRQPGGGPHERTAPQAGAARAAGHPHRPRRRLRAPDVTAVPAERRSDSLESRWRQALETAPEVYVALDGDGRIADWNRAASALFVVGRDDVLGSTMARFVADQHREQVQVDLQAAMLRPLDAQHEPVQLELRTHTGRSFAAEWLVWAVDRRAGTLAHCFIRDVTERRRSQQTAALLAAVVEGSKDAIITEGRDGRITSWNAAAERMYGWAAETAVGSPSYLIVPLDKVPEHTEMIARVFAGDPVRGVETERVSRGGARIPVEVRMSRSRRLGEVVAVSTVARDVTEQRWMAETLDSTLLQLQTALSEAQTAEESSRRFLADAAHQLRTPLAGIRGCAELLLRGAARATATGCWPSWCARPPAPPTSSPPAAHRRLDQGEPLPRGEVDLARLCQDEVEGCPCSHPSSSSSSTSPTPPNTHCPSTRAAATRSSAISPTTPGGTRAAGSPSR
jgi:PAS domain S-box-containing protein